MLSGSRLRLRRAISGRSRRLAALSAGVALAAFGATAALGYWSGGVSGDGGLGTAGATTVSAGATPTVYEAGATEVVVSWGPSSLYDGTPVAGYVVRRYAVATGTLATIGAACSGTITALTCTETATPAGDWQYTVTPVFAANWRGLESPKSGAVDTAPGTMTIQRTLFGGTVAPLPATVTGTISGFASSDALTYTLDDSVPLTGSPANAGALGTASFSLTIPAGTSDGPHTVTIHGLLAGASVGIVVDTTAPTINAFTTPAPNAAGWNVTSPVEVGATVDDANGSGVSYARYTTDGSDPRTSPTGQIPTGPVSVATTTTLKFYLVDLAGNQSPVQTLTVKIDLTVPVFSLAFVNVQGGVYRSPSDPITHVPGPSYYRGAAAGSLRFQMTPSPLGGSPAVAAGFSALPAGAVGFSFDSSSVTTPLGGPFVSNPMSWVAGTTSNPSGTISLTNQAGTTFGVTGGLYNDSAAPAGGAVDATGLTGTGGRYSTSLSLSLTLAKGTDAASGLADGTGQTDVQAQLLRASAPLSSSNGVVNGGCGTYSAYAQVGGLDPASTLSDTMPTDRSCYRYEYLVSDHVGNIAIYVSPDIKVIATPAASLTPTAATLTPVSGIAAQSVAGSTVYYNPAQLGSFSVDTSVSAPNVGVAQVTFPAVAGFTGGGAVTQPLTGTTFRSTYAWSANGASPSPGAQPLSATNNAGNTATNASAFSVLADATGPSGGSVDAGGLGGTGGRYSTTLALSLGLVPGADGGAGLAATGARLLRASASLSSSGGITNGVCGTYGAYGQVGVNDPVTPVSDTVPVDRTCYRYAYVVSDKVGNQTTYTTPDIKVQAALPPAPALTFSALSSAYWSGSGTTVYYLPAGSGGFRVTATSADLTSGTTGYAFPTLPTGWTGSSGGSGILNYAWGPGAPTAPSGAQSVTTSNNAGASAAASFTAVPDGAAPTGGSVAYTNGYSTSTSASVTIVAATDAGSGLAPAGAMLQRASATLSAGSCGTFTAFATIATGPTSPYTDPVATATCYEYRYLVSDNLGNQATFTNAGVLKIDTSGPTHAISLAAGAAGASLTGSTLFYASNTAGSFKLVDTLTGALPPASATYPLLGIAGWTHAAETVSTPSGGPYTSSTFSWTANPSSPSTYAVSAQNTLGTASTATLTFTADSSTPTGGTVDATGLSGAGSRYSTSLTLHVALAPGSDGGSGVAASGLLLLRATASLSSTTGAVAGVCGTYGGFAQVGASDPTSPVTDTVTTANKCYRYEYLVPDRVGNVATYVSPDIKVETVAPSSLTPASATITPLTGAASQLITGSTVYYNAAQSGSFNVDSAASDATSGIGQLAFPVIAGFAGGGSVTTPTTGTTFRTAYSWSNNSASPSPGPQSLTATDGAGLAATKTSAFSVLADPGPTGGAIDAFSLGGTGGRWSTSLSLSGPFTKGTSPVGLAATGAQLLQATAPLTTNGSGACGSYTAFVLVAVDPPSPQAATLPTDHECYRYEYSVPDTLGVTTVYSSADIKVDTTPPPTPTLGFSGFSNSYWSGSGSTVYYRSSVASAFTITASSSDIYAGIASYAFPTFASWTSTGGALGVDTYNTAGSTVAATNQHITATNNAGASSGNASFTVAPDGTAPGGTGISISHPANAGPVTVTLNPTDAESGVRLSTGLLSRASGTTCSNIGAFVTIATAPASPYTDAGLPTGHCYKYQYQVSDNVGNPATYLSGTAQIN